MYREAGARRETSEFQFISDFVIRTYIARDASASEPSPTMEGGSCGHSRGGLPTEIKVDERDVTRVVLVRYGNTSTIIETATRHNDKTRDNFFWSDKLIHIILNGYKNAVKPSIENSTVRTNLKEWFAPNSQLRRLVALS